MSAQSSSPASRREHLKTRRAKKAEILTVGGEQALSHSPKDLLRIDLALKRLDEGSYGLCCNCGTEIGEARLNLIPETPLCKPCADLATN